MHLNNIVMYTQGNYRQLDAMPDEWFSVYSMLWSMFDIRFLDIMSTRDRWMLCLEYWASGQGSVRSWMLWRHCCRISSPAGLSSHQHRCAVYVCKWMTRHSLTNLLKLLTVLEISDSVVVSWNWCSLDFPVIVALAQMHAVMQKLTLWGTHYILIRIELKLKSRMVLPFWCQLAQVVQEKMRLFFL